MKLYQVEQITSVNAVEAAKTAGVYLIGSGCIPDDCEALWTRLKPVTAKMLHFMPDCRYVCCPCTGLDHIDTDECERRGIKVISLNGLPGLRSVRATIELTIGLILALTRRIPAAAADVTEGRWNRYSFEGVDLSGKRAGIVGYGRVGQCVGHLLDAFGMEVAYHDPNVAGSMPFKELLGWADLITVHAALTRESRWMFDRAAFEAMKPGAYFVNTARGGLVDDHALLDYLYGPLAGVALDVAENEPAISEWLREAAKRPQNNLIITPHIGGCTREAIEATEGMVMDALLKEVGNAQEKANPVARVGALGSVALEGGRSVGE